MKFHLDHIPAPAATPITHDSSIVLIGSCFSENIGQLLVAHGFNASVNPGGIYFNPASISDFLTKVIKQELPENNSYLQRGNTFFNYHHHSSISGDSDNELKKKLTHLYSETKKQLTDADFLFITFGTAFVYLNQQLNAVVANCHKQPQQQFEKKLLPVDEIISRFTELFLELKKINPKLKVIFTVSPVKHLRDGVEENSLSKSSLILSIHQIIKKTNDCSYFPAFELVNDDLRDYRFYTQDMAHPNDEAIRYIWEKFGLTFFNKETADLSLEIDKLNTAKAHRVLHDNPAEAKNLQEYMAAQKKRILSRNPRLKL